MEENTAPVQVDSTLSQTGRLQLKVDGQAIPIGPGPQPLRDTGWTVCTDGKTALLECRDGIRPVQLGSRVLSRLVLTPGQSVELGGARYWVVDARQPFLGTLESMSPEAGGPGWHIGYQPLRVGRQGSARVNEIELNHPTVSRIQATLQPSVEGGVELLCESPNSPVLVNEQRLAPGQVLRLRHGDRLQFGELCFRFRETFVSNLGQCLVEGSLPGRIGPYPVLGKLGSGGMAIVYEGLDIDGSPVALKVPLPHLLTEPEFVRRFNREMKLGTELDHPRLTRILDFQPAGENAYPYLVMEKLVGAPLDALELRPSVQEALLWTSQLLEALDYLHSHGVVHRDLKPANLYRTADGIKVADLGIAHFSGTLGDRATQTGAILGTPLYLDPAMLRGQLLDGRCDLYATGLMLYEWLLGHLPYPEDPLQVFALKLEGDIPPLAHFCPDLPRELLDFVERLRHPDPEQRFRSAMEASRACPVPT